MHRPTVYLLHHFFHPDDVISSRLFSDLAEALDDVGYQVVALPGCCAYKDPKQRLPLKDEWGAVTIRRLYRPGLHQQSTVGRLINAIFLLVGWSFRALVMGRRPGEVMIVGSDPIFAVLVAIPWRLFRPRSRIIHWCHDVYPQAAVADGVMGPRNPLVRLLNILMRIAYRRCDSIVDLGPCMRSMLVEAIGVEPQFAAIPERKDSERSSGVSSRRGMTTDAGRIKTRFETIPPWSLVEPEMVGHRDTAIREKLFGENASLGLLYSGNMGRAHDYKPLVRLAESLDPNAFAFCFAGRGPGIDQLRAEAANYHLPIRFAGFADERELLLRLTAADVHMVSLRENWTGTVVPSKFFGALAVGRPVLFAGSDDSAIAVWIRKFNVGWVVNERSMAEVQEQLVDYAAAPDAMEQMRERCHRVYHDQFSKSVQIDRWLNLVSGDCQEDSTVGEMVKDSTSNEELAVSSRHAGG